MTVIIKVSKKKHGETVKKSSFRIKNKKTSMEIKIKGEIKKKKKKKNNKRS